jgi:hypothetical protein
LDARPSELSNPQGRRGLQLDSACSVPFLFTSDPCGRGGGGVACLLFVDLVLCFLWRLDLAARASNSLYLGTNVGNFFVVLSSMRIQVRASFI